MSSSPASSTHLTELATNRDSLHGGKAHKRILTQHARSPTHPRPPEESEHLQPLPNAEAAQRRQDAVLVDSQQPRLERLAVITPPRAASASRSAARRSTSGGAAESAAARSTASSTAAPRAPAKATAAAPRRSPPPRRRRHRSSFVDRRPLRRRRERRVLLVRSGLERRPAPPLIAPAPPNTACSSWASDALREGREVSSRSPSKARRSAASAAAAPPPSAPPPLAHASRWRSREPPIHAPPTLLCVTVDCACARSVATSISWLAPCRRSVAASRSPRTSSDMGRRWSA